MQHCKAGDRSEHHGPQGFGYGMAEMQQCRGNHLERGECECSGIDRSGVFEEIIHQGKNEDAPEEQFPGYVEEKNVAQRVQREKRD